MVYDKNNSSLIIPVMSSLLNIMSDGRMEYKTEGRQILYRYKLIYIYVNIVHVIVYIYIPMAKATCKMNFNVQFIDIEYISSYLLPMSI